NFFTPDLIVRGSSPKPRVAEAARAEWADALARYRRRWDRLRGAFPPAARRLHDEEGYLHGAELLGMGREGDRFILVLQPGPPAKSGPILRFGRGGWLGIDGEAVRGGNSRGRVPWLCEEFDLDRKKGCGFEVLLSKGWSVKLRFRDLHSLVANRLFPAAKAAR